MFLTRRQALGSFGSIVIATRLRAASGKPLRGVFPIMATPFTPAKGVDFEDLRREVDFLDRWFCAGNGNRGTPTTGVEGLINGSLKFPYDYAGVCPQ